MATVTEIRKQLDGSICSDVRSMARIFDILCEENPEAVAAAVRKSSSYLSKMDDTKMGHFITMLSDRAKYIAGIFHFG